MNLLENFPPPRHCSVCKVCGMTPSCASDHQGHFLHFGEHCCHLCRLTLLGPSPQSQKKAATRCFFFFPRDAASKAPHFPCAEEGAEECDGSIPQLRAPSLQQNVLQSCSQTGCLSEFQIKHCTFSPQLGQKGLFSFKTLENISVYVWVEILGKK